jgi:hypothetical protein
MVNFYYIFARLSAFKTVSLPGISHSLGSRLYFFFLLCWNSVRSLSPPCTPLATRSHVCTTKQYTFTYFADSIRQCSAPALQLKQLIRQCSAPALQFKQLIQSELDTIPIKTSYVVHAIHTHVKECQVQTFHVSA